MQAPPQINHTLVLGGARSGKSAFAQTRAEAADAELVYIATAHAGDAEMARRIARHRGERGPRWRTVEEPLELAARLGEEARAGRIVLVDCLTLWLSNIMFAGRDAEAEGTALAGALAALKGPVIFVSNEVGSGIVPDNVLARDFRDAQGRLNQRMAAACGSAFLIVAGLPLTLKGR